MEKFQANVTPVDDKLATPSKNPKKRDDLDLENVVAVDIPNDEQPIEVGNPETRVIDTQDINVNQDGKQNDDRFGNTGVKKSHKDREEQDEIGEM